MQTTNIQNYTDTTSDAKKRARHFSIANGEIPTSELWINVIISVSRIVSLAVSACNVVVNILHEAKTSGLICNIMRMRM